MAVTFKSQILLGSAPSTGMHAATKTYADLKKTEAIAYVDAAIATLADAGANYDQLSELLALINANDGTAAAALATKLSKSGGTMTGALVLAADGASALQATTVQQVESLIADAIDALNSSLGDSIAGVQEEVDDLEGVVSTLTSTVSTNASTAASATATVASNLSTLTSTVSTNASTAASATATVASNLSTLTSTVSTNASTAAAASAAAQAAADTAQDEVDALEAVVATLTTTVGTPIVKYAATITGDASATNFTVTHNIGNQDVVVTVREVANPKAVVLVNYEVTSNSVITIKFDDAPGTGVAYRVVVLG